jgi:DNA invertase Pin-like site-specific DNA recombinase
VADPQHTVIAAIYARKSTEQRDVDPDQKSVTRQIAHARAYAERKGWAVDETCIFVDDGISGAEFGARPGFLRLMNALTPRPRVQVLVMSEESRLGREMIQTAAALRQILRAGVRVFFYLEDRERTLTTPTEKFMLSATAFADELEREKARQRAHDTMRRKFEQHHVTGGQCFGYRNVDVCTPGPDGRPRRQYVRREIHQDEAAVVRTIFERCAAGEGLKAIAKRLNADGVLAPRSQCGRPRAWAPTSIRAILYRESYRGLIVWNKSRKRNQDGEKRQRPRPPHEWLRDEAEQLRIVSEALWHAAHARLADRRRHYRCWTRGDVRDTILPRPSHTPYLLSGFGRCALCGGSMQAVSRASTRRGRRVRLFRYVCGNFANRGASVCRNGALAAMTAADDAIRSVLRQEILRTPVLERALDLAVATLQAGEARAQDHTAQLARRIAALETELERLAEVAARGGDVPAIAARLTRTDRERRALVEALAACRAAPASGTPRMDAAAARRELRGYLEGWDDLTSADVPSTRALLDVALRSRIVFRPIDAQGALTYELTVPLQLDRVLVRAVPALSRVRDSSPMGLAGCLTRDATVRIAAL